MRDLLLFAITIGLVPIILLRPWVGILAWFWVGLFVPHAHTWGFMRTFQIAVVIGLATLIALFLTKDRRPMPYTREMAMMFILAGYFTLTSYFAVNPTGAWAQWDTVMKIMLITFVTPILIYGQRRIVPLLLIITFSIGFYGIKGGFFAISTGGAHMVLGPPRSFLAGNTYIGLAMLMILPLILASARMFYYQWIDFGWPWIRSWSKYISWGIYAAFWLTIIAILATHSRGALLGFLAILPFLFLRMQYKGTMIAAALIGVLVLGVTVPDPLLERWKTIQTYQEDDSSMQRIQAWGANWNMAKERPLLGMGFRHTGKGFDWWLSYANFDGGWGHHFSAHSIYFQMLGQHGFGGLAIWLLLIGFTFHTLHRIRRTAAKRKNQLWLAEFAWALQVGLIGFMAAGTFLDVAYFNLLYAFIALTIIMRRELEESESPTVIETATTGDRSKLLSQRIRFPDFIASAQVDAADKKNYN
ncbi:putative O-glycosylation ligase, exosortase A system-associated [Ectothiorhodospira lacustris]|uniref:putative O-glycosylation ligase, exosortase A system-associated n=1 Tax=Ectothiorhodospira lacustris TaxID=2899127 RepID=UPI001EE82F17|nr:putative O-glycosylation ligase, exosortase A system-associated [Ectothiorhodospira lacustris]MCG5510351.1 putative O-glycosylation ligase, exosortase A system-associated [Ectothiorhodospira lacustris]MCG5522097.1 putative O-glycosylation ligase, exosortase A system-associated [Ectothiorhodospira lacustris]